MKSKTAARTAKTEAMLYRIKEAILISDYGRKEKEIVELLETPDWSAMAIATEICDILDIERRYNRRAIAGVIEDCCAEFKNDTAHE